MPASDHKTANGDAPRSLNGSCVLLTGGTTGIGRAVALSLVTAGARVLTFGRHQPELDETLAAAAGKGPGELHGVLADVAESDDIRRVFEEVDQRLGRLDILINNAALGAGSVLESDRDEWDYVVRTNLLGYMECCRLAFDRMRAQGGGDIVNIGSMSAKSREADSDLYVATKSGVEGFSEALGKKANEYGVRVMLIEPGLVGTDMTVDKVPAEEQAEAQRDETMMRAEDIAACVEFCVSRPHRVEIALMQVRPHRTDE